MGESPPTKVEEQQMDESGTDHQVGSGDVVGRLQVSVSFGKYENELLSWEKWSAFPSNKYLEEVEKYSTPGSVAQKKAYFEAHYKKIAARKQQQMQLEQEHIDQQKMNYGNEVLSGHDQLAALEDQTASDSRDNHSCVVVSDGDEKSRVEGGVDECGVDEEGVECGKEERVNVTCEIGGSSVDEPTADAGFGQTNGRRLVIEDAGDESSMRKEERINMTCEIGGSSVDEPTADADFGHTNGRQLGIEDASDEYSTRLDSPKLNKAEELVFIREEAPSLGSQDMEECHPDKETGAGANGEIKELQQDVNNARRNAPVHKPGKVKSDAPKKQQKVIATKKPNTIAATKKKPASTSPRSPATSTLKTAKPALPKSVLSASNTAKPALAKSATSIPEITKSGLSKSFMSTLRTAKAALSKSDMSTPKTAKAAPSKSLMSTTKSSVKKENNYTPLNTNNRTTQTERRRVAPTSLQMSLSLGPAKSESVVSLPETRKSSFMESMGDKEIVRRAFKAFQNRYDQQPSSGVRKPSPTTQVLEKVVETKGSALDTFQMKSEGEAKSVKNAVQKCPQGTRRIPMSSGSLDTSVADQRNGRTFPISFGPRTLDKLSKKSDGKSKSSQAVNIQPQNKPKLEKREETRKLGQRLDLKSKPTAASYRRPEVTMAN